MTAARFRLVAVCISCAAISASAVDRVIFKDGFTIVGKRITEQERISDPKNGTSVTIPKARGFDYMETGPKWIIYSNRTQQVGSVLENVRGDSDFKEYVRQFLVTGRSPLPAGGIVKVGDFDEKWKRIIRVDMPANKSFAEIEQRIYSVSPSRIVMPSANYLWYPFYDTREFSPEQVRKMLSTHPDLVEKDGPEISKRLEIAEFMKDAGWHDHALREITDAKAAIPAAWPKELSEHAEKLSLDIRKAQTARLVVEIERAVRAGKYATAKSLIDTFDEKSADPRDAKLFATMKAQLEIVVPRADKAKKLLRTTLDRLAGGNHAIRAALGGGNLIGALAPALTPEQAALHAAGNQVLAELHPDTVDRIDFFLSLGEQVERRLAGGQNPGTTPEQLIALAVTGWLKGKNGAEQSVESALRYWKWRDMLLAYQSEPVRNKRRDLYLALTAPGTGLSPDEIAQLIGYLPPPEAENLERRSGTLIQDGPTPITGIYRRNTGPIPETASGIDYLVRLPNEYHHGRPSRLIVALTNNNVPPEDLVGLLSTDADRHGAIIIAPAWVTPYDGPYDWTGTQHFKTRAVIRDALKHFRIDNDRVFLFGYGEGANYAMDLGASHPDLFAGVVAMGANPKHFNMFMHYWRNYQKLPIYLCIGSIAGDAFTNLRRVFEDWMPKGYPALGVVYRGRSMEWFAPEVPVIFEWMEPKKRVLGTAVLRLNEPVEPWMSMRDEDDRFYWVGSTKLDPNCTLKEANSRAKPSVVDPTRPPVPKSFLPAEIRADIRDGNRIVLNTRGTKNVVIWLDRNMVDWSKPISVTINGSVPHGYKAKVLEPDIELMLEQLWQHGDRSLLFLNRLEFPTVR